MRGGGGRVPPVAVPPGQVTRAGMATRWCAPTRRDGAVRRDEERRRAHEARARIATRRGGVLNRPGPGPAARSLVLSGGNGPRGRS
ncbi:hypothetical protein SSBG_06131 [Streptomyces sp. SPB074]|nr:hypothetical protein SSBG_06131 [Streptomyces sp. SPB074]